MRGRVLVSVVFVLCGCEGSAGLSSLVRLDDEPPGANCAAGGIAIHTGADSNGNGVLDDVEIEQTEYVCNGVDGEDGGDSALLRIDPEPSGANCARGGFALSTGTDDDADGFLDDEEIDATEYVCNEPVFSALIRVDIEAPGVNCAEGGLAVHSGVDANENGELDDVEIADTDFVCNAASLAALVRVDDEPPGGACVDGGVAVHAGVDANANGTLEDVEITSTNFVCDATTGDTLIRVDDEPAGPNCLDGGLAVHTGPDANDNGLLDDAEIATTEFVCSGGLSVGGVLDGTAVINNSADVLALSGFTEITGDLESVFTDISVIDLPNLEIVRGDVNIRGADFLFLDALVSVEGDFDVGSIRDSFSMQSLTTIGGDATIFASESADLRSLVSTGGDFLVGGMSTSLRVDSLTTVGARLRIGNYRQSNLSAFSSLEVVGSFQLIGSGTDLRQANVPTLTTVIDDVMVTDPGVQALRLVGLTSVGGDFAIRSAGSLATLEFPLLTTIGGDVDIERYRGSNLSSLSALESIGGALEITASLFLTSIGLDGLTSLGSSLQISCNSVLPTSEAEALRDQLVAAGYMGTVNIFNNGTGPCP